MPAIELRFKKGGRVQMDFMGFPGNSCEQAEDELKERLKSLKFDTQDEEPKEDELLQEEQEYE